MSAPAHRARGFILLTVVLALTLVAAIAFLLSRSAGINMSMAARGLQADRMRYIAEAGLAQINNQTQNRNCAGYTDLPATAFGADSFVATVNPKAGNSVTLVATATSAATAPARSAVATLTRTNVTVNRAPINVTLQAADSSGIDTSLSGTNPTKNYGASPSLLVQSPPTLSIGLIQFDLSSIPAGSKITTATLKLSKSNGSFFIGTITVYRVTTLWLEGTQNGGALPIGASYNSPTGVLPWTTPGGDYDPAAAASLTNIMQGWNSWDVTSLVQGWIALSYLNFGMILVPTSINVLADFVSSDDASPVHVPFHPKLDVTYTAPCA